MRGERVNGFTVLEESNPSPSWKATTASPNVRAILAFDVRQHGTEYVTAIRADGAREWYFGKYHSDLSAACLDYVKRAKDTESN